MTIDQIKQLWVSALHNSDTIQSHLTLLSNSDYINTFIWDSDLSDNAANDHGFNERLKGQKLTNAQLIHLKSIINRSNLTSTQISQKFNISISQVNKIKRMDEENIKAKPIRNFIKLNKSEWKSLTKELLSFNSNTDTTFNVKDITNYANKQLKTNYPTQFVKNFMKIKLNFSYKRVKPRPNNIDLKRLEWIRRLFSIKFSQLVDSNTLIINIDESSIGRNTKQNYSWGIRGYPIEAKVISIKGSISQWTALFSNGNWLSMVTSKTFNSECFLLFLKHLIKMINDNNNFGFNKIILIMDNWSIHKWNKVKKNLKEVNLIVFFIPTYSLHLAPIEMFFGLLKKRIWINLKNEMVKISDKAHFSKILDSYKEINKSTIQKMYSRFFKEIQQYLKF